ncbi:MAG TPA: hypothetical protein VNX01_13215 [Bacteroidia bacterium]|nr:hypothetical protein [Bacteroidia bacterium]
MEKLKQTKGLDNDKEMREFIKTIKNISAFGEKMDKVLYTLTKSDENWFTNSFMKIVMR